MKTGTSVLNRVLPREVDNRFRGSKLAVWLPYPITLVAFFLAGVHAFLPDSGARSIAAIPLDSFTADGASTTVAFIAQWG